MWVWPLDELVNVTASAPVVRVCVTVLRVAVDQRVLVVLGEFRVDGEAAEEVGEVDRPRGCGHTGGPAVAGVARQSTAMAR